MIQQELQTKIDNLEYEVLALKKIILTYIANQNSSLVKLYMQGKAVKVIYFNPYEEIKPINLAVPAHIFDNVLEDLEEVKHVSSESIYKSQKKHAK